MFVYLYSWSALVKLADLVLSLTTGDGWIAKLGWKILLQYESGSLQNEKWRNSSHIGGRGRGCNIMP